jgi:DNA-binding NarL/FixJ family response regulator
VPTSVLIVDDHDEFRARVRELLLAAGYRVVGEAADAAGAVAQTRALQPDVLVLDVQLPDGDGFSVAAELDRARDAPLIVLISSREAADYGSRIAESAAVGFIHKPELTRARVAELVGLPD